MKHVSLLCTNNMYNEELLGHKELTLAQSESGITNAAKFSNAASDCSPHACKVAGAYSGEARNNKKNSVMS